MTTNIANNAVDNTLDNVNYDIVNYDNVNFDEDYQDDEEDDEEDDYQYANNTHWSYSECIKWVTKDSPVNKLYI